MPQLQPVFEQHDNPIDLVEELAHQHDWIFDRSSDDELSLSIEGRWSDYHVSFNWREDLEGLHLACTFDVRVPLNRRGAVSELVTLINERLWSGHFDLWKREGTVLFRNTLLLAGLARANTAQCSALLYAALDVCERYYPAFQFVMWAGRSAEEAIDAVSLETQGEA